MFRTGMCCFGLKKWIFLIAYVNLFTYIQGVEDDEGVRFLQEPSDVVVAAGENILLACAAASRANPRLTWRHNDKAPPTREHTISITDKYRRQLANGSLLIEHMSASLAGQYQCVATVDGVGTIVSRVATVFLAELPEVLSGPRSVLGIVGAPVLLPCAVRASPRLAVRVVPATPDRRVYGSTRQHHTPPTLKLNVTWLKNGSPVRLESARAAVTPSGALELDAARAHDAARYACRVALAHAPHTYTTSEEIELRISSEVGAVESSPRFVATPQPITVIEGASVTFDCAAVGNPKPEMIWLNNGAAIDLSDLDSRFYLVGSGSLRVQSARALDAGAYTCRAHSRLDSADHSATLHVLSVPRVTVGNPSDKGVVVARTRGDVTLRCEAKGRPTPTVTWLKDGEPLTPNNHDIALVDGTSLRIQGVLRVDAGMFQCAAISPAGTAVAGLRLLVQSPDDETGISNATLLQTSHKSKTKHPKKQKPSHIVSPTNGTVQNPNSTQDIFNSLISSTQFEDQNLDPAPEDLDFVGETSSAFTSGPEFEYDDGFEYDYDTDYMFHAAQGLDLDELRKGNATLVSPPHDLRAVIVKHRFVTLSWQEPENTKEHITGYAVVYKVKGSNRERVARGGAQKHEMNVASLQPNTTYEFAVLAFAQNAHSPLTDVISVTTPEEELSYGPPLNVRVEASGPHSLKVSWLPPEPPPEPASSAPPYPPTKYSIHYYETESGREQVQWVEAADGVGAAGGVGAAVGGLRAAATYSVRVCAAGGALSAEVRARTRSDAPAAPPANVTAAPSGPHSILVRWEAPPARTHRGPLTGYKVRYRALPAGPQGISQGQTRRKADALTTPADARRAELRQLHTHTTYQIRVCAINANGSGPFSEWVTATTQQQELDESVVPPQPPPLTTRAGRDWISVWWSEEGGSVGGASSVGGGVVVRGYWLGWGLGVPDEHTQEVPAHLHSHVIRGLASNSEYVISLRASNALGLGPAVYATVRTRTASELDGDGDEDEDEPGDEDADGDEDEDESPPLIPPVGVKVIMLSGSTAVVYWTDPTLAKGTTASDGRRYVVRWATPGLRARYFNATDLNCMLDDLKPYTDYEFAVKLIRGQRESAWSMLVSNRTLEALPASAPRDLRAAPAAPAGRALELSWQPPLKPHGRLTGYVLMYCANDAPDDWAAVAVTGGDRVRARIDRLRPRTTYLFKVQARNSKGLGPFSQPISYTTPVETGGGSGLAGATSAWLWASAGGACAVLALAAALALSLCCRRSHPPLSPDTSTYQKSSASAAIKPPDLWIHHDQMELKHMDKSLHSSAISAGSVEGVGGGGAGGGLMSSTLTLARAAHAPPAEYEPARHHTPASLASLSSLDRRHYVPTYVERRSPCACSQSAASSDDTAILRASPASIAPLKRCDACLYDYKSMTGVSCASTCERRPHRAALQLPHTDQSTPLLAGVAPLGSPQAPLGPLGPQQGPLHHPCPLMPGTGSDIYASAARERGHYVAYEPLGHYTHRDSLSSECGTAGSSGAGVGVGPGSVGTARAPRPRTARTPTQLHAPGQLQFALHAQSRERQRKRDVPLQEERQLFPRTSAQQTSTRGERGALLRGVGASDSVAVDGEVEPRDAEPRRPHEGPVGHHPAAVPLLTHFSPRLYTTLHYTTLQYSTAFVSLLYNLANFGYFKG